MKHKLEALRGEIPPYAIWQVPVLTGVFVRYREILDAFCNEKREGTDCRVLIQNINLISAFLLSAERYQSATAYNRAAAELGWDIDQLIRMI